VEFSLADDPVLRVEEERPESLLRRMLVSDEEATRDGLWVGGEF